MKQAQIKAGVKATIARAKFGFRGSTDVAPHGSIVLFHRVSDRYPGDTLTITRKMFDRYVRILRTHFDLIPLQQLVTMLKERQPLSGKLALSFDDGYQDNYEYAAPILAKYSAPCTFFVATKFIESQTVPWWDEHLPEKPAWMTWEQVRELMNSGFDIGSHTLNHVDLGKVKGEEARKEIFESKRELKTRLGKDVPLFSYPYGRQEQMTEANRQLVREAGYEACFSAYGGVVPRDTDPYHIRRQPVSGYHLGPWMYLYELVKMQARAR